MIKARVVATSIAVPELTTISLTLESLVRRSLLIKKLILCVRHNTNFALILSFAAITPPLAPRPSLSQISAYNSTTVQRLVGMYD